jgi:hypothetical protein
MKPLITSVLLSLVTTSLSFSQITETKIPGTVVGFGAAVAIEADHLLIGSLQPENRGSGHFYRSNGDEWTFVQTFEGERSSYDRFGAAVDISGDIALIGDSDRSSGTHGSFYTYLYNGAIWQKTDLTIGGVGVFANSVCLVGNSALIGSIWEGFNGSTSGAAIAYTTTGSGWVADDTLLADDGEAYDEFGNSVSFDGDFGIVGAHETNAAGGSAYFFQRSGQTWNQIVTRTGNDTAPGDRFGTSVSLSGEYALVGAPFADTEQSNSGAAYIFKQDGSTWIQQAKLVAGDRSSNDHFGIAVSLQGDYAVIGAEAGDGLVTNSGTAYIFKREGDSWNQIIELNASDGVEYQHFGNSVDISAGDVVVGATGRGYPPYVHGSVYVYSGYAESQASVVVSIDSIYQSVPPQGAKFPYNLTFTNNTADTLTIDFWTKLIRPDGGSVDPFVGPKTPVLGPHAVIDKSPIMSVPANRDPGEYLLIAYLGTYPSDTLDTDTTGFTKLASSVAKEQVAMPSLLEPRLGGNYPNPFNPSTTIRYTLNNDGPVSVRVYNMLGEEVATLVDGFQKAGEQSVTWDGTNNFGQVVASGLYIYRLQAGSTIVGQKMLFAK